MGDLTSESRRAGSLYYGRLFLLSWLLLAFTLSTAALAQTTDADERVYVYVGDYNYPPYEFLDQEGRPSGFNIEMMRAIADEAGIELRFHLGPWPHVLKALAAGEADISSMYYSPARDAIADYAQPLHIAHSQIFQRRDSPPIESLEALNGLEILVQSDSVTEDYLRDKFPDAHPITVDSEPEALQVLASGNFDAALVSREVGLHAIRLYELENLYAPLPPLLPSHYTFVVTQGNTALLGLINAGLTELRSTGVYAALRARWLEESRPEPWLVRNQGLVAAALGLLVLLLVGIYAWNLSLRRRVEERTATLNESEARYRALIERAPEAIVIYDGDTDSYAAINPAAAELFGLADRTRARLTPDNASPARQPDGAPSQERAQHYLRRALAGEPQVFEWTHQTLQGRPFDAEVRLIRLPGGRPLVRATIIDISERKRAERALMGQMRLNQEILNGMMDGYVLVDTDLRIHEANTAYCRLTGYNRDELLNMSMTTLDPRLADDDLRRRLIERIRKEGGRHVESRHRRKDGSFMDIEGSLILHHFEGQELFAGFIRDVTERRAHARRLRQAATVFANTTEGVIIADQDCRILSVNPAFAGMMGQDAAELEGQPVSALLSDPQQAEDFERSLKATVDEVGHWQGEIKSRRHSGELFPAWLNISRVVEENDTAAGYIVILADISEVKASEQRLEHLAHHDALTGLPNTLLLHARLEHAMAHANREGKSVAVVFIDLDRFKYVNDNLGHPIGDALLKEAAQRLCATLRKEDTVARLGGDEFILLLEQLDGAADAVPVVEKVLQQLEKPFYIAGHELMISGSMGIALYPSDGTDITTLLKNADSAMYTAKKERGNFHFYDPSLAAQAAERFQLEQDLRNAVERGELYVLYQPQIDLQTRRIIGVEALLRWRHPTHGDIAPAHFIPVAEETGMVQSLGGWVLREAMRQSKRWQSDALSSIRMSVNISARQVLKEDLADVISGMLAETGLQPSQIELELTETTLMELSEASRETLERLRAMGVHLAVDDFGTGYSSLSYLKDLPVKTLKIDRAFVEGLPDDPDSIAICKAVISMGHSLGMQVIAEGVETQAQLDALSAAGCDIAQGFFISRPIPAEAITRLHGSRSGRMAAARPHSR